MSILAVEVGFNWISLVDALVASSERVHYSNCKECVNNNNDTDDGVILSVLKSQIMWFDVGSVYKISIIFNSIPFFPNSCLRD